MLKVLVVDDEETLVELFSDIIQAHISCEVDSASNGLDAFLMCQENEYDLICTDHEMPLMKGNAFIVALRNKENINKETPVIFISGYVEMAKEDTEALDKVLFLEKPMKPEKFVKYAKMLLGSKLSASDS